jgi:hypothetical protein
LWIDEILADDNTAEGGIALFTGVKPRLMLNEPWPSGSLCNLDADGREFLDPAAEEFHLSAGAYNRIFKVSQTIADVGREQRFGPRMS